jgi:hypothetical protein
MENLPDRLDRETRLPYFQLVDTFTLLSGSRTRFRKQLRRWLFVAACSKSN